MIIRKSVRSIVPYEWELSDEEIAAKVGLSQSQIIRFDTNSSPYQPTDLLQDLLTNIKDLRVNEYPDTSYTSIRKLIASYCGVDTGQITITNGADEGLDIASKTFLDVGCNAVISTPTYAMYRILVQILGCTVRDVVRREDFSDDIVRINESIDDKTGIVFLCSPNNPTGNLVGTDTLASILENNKTVVLDEAYYEFCGQSFVDATRKYDNLVIARTFSKAFGMAGARVGYLIASRSTNEMMSRVRPPNSLSVISLKLAELALRNVNRMKERVDKITRERDRVAVALGDLKGIEVLNTKTNFVLVRFKEIDAQSVHQALMRWGIISRDVSRLPLLQNTIRFTIRTPEHNNFLLEKLSSIVGG